MLHNVDGGVSCALRMLLRAMLLQDGGNFVDGVVLDLDAGPTMFFAQFRSHLGDEAALSRGLSCKGASGMRPCIRCAILLKKKTVPMLPALESSRLIASMKTSSSQIQMLRSFGNSIW